MFKYIFWVIAIYLLVRFIFNFVIPVYRATRQMRNQVKDFQNHMQDQQEQYQAGYSQQQEQKRTNSQAKKEDYIDFEEVK